MRLHRNRGAPFVRDDGETTWRRGAVHEPTPRELAMRRHKLEPESDLDPETESESVRAENEGGESNPEAVEPPAAVSQADGEGTYEPDPEADLDTEEG